MRLREVPPPWVVIMVPSGALSNSTPRLFSHWMASGASVTRVRSSSGLAWMPPSAIMVLASPMRSLVTTMTLAPALSASMAAEAPAPPPPMMSTSTS